MPKGGGTSQSAGGNGSSSSNQQSRGGWNQKSFSHNSGSSSQNWNSSGPAEPLCEFARELLWEKREERDNVTVRSKNASRNSSFVILVKKPSKIYLESLLAVDVDPDFLRRERERSADSRNRVRKDKSNILTQVMEAAARYSRKLLRRRSTNSDPGTPPRRSNEPREPQRIISRERSREHDRMRFTDEQYEDFIRRTFGRSPSRDKKEKKRSRDRSHDRDRKERSREREKAKKNDKDKEKDKEKNRDDKDAKDKDRDADAKDDEITLAQRKWLREQFECDTKISNDELQSEEWQAKLTLAAEKEVMKKPILSVGGRDYGTKPQILLRMIPYAKLLAP